jgi:hypothetical protein
MLTYYDIFGKYKMIDIINNILYFSSEIFFLLGIILKYQDDSVYTLYLFDSLLVFLLAQCIVLLQFIKTII